MMVPGAICMFPTAPITLEIAPGRRSMNCPIAKVEKSTLSQPPVSAIRKAAIAPSEAILSSAPPAVEATP